MNKKKKRKKNEWKTTFKLCLSLLFYLRSLVIIGGPIFFSPIFHLKMAIISINMLYMRYGAF